MGAQDLASIRTNVVSGATIRRNGGADDLKLGTVLRVDGDWVTVAWIGGPPTETPDVFRWQDSFVAGHYTIIAVP